MGLNVNLLGGFTAAVDGVAVPDTAWRLKKARELVKLLALARDHRLHREQAMDVLWRDLAPAAAANTLHQAVHVARRALGPDAIEVRDEVLSLVADVDVDLLERLAADARRMRTAAAYGIALSLYRGELLPENRYDEWVETRRDELAALAAELTEEAAALGDSARSALPAETSSFVGRKRELGELEALLRRTRMLTLAGTGGVGKTRLALELARNAQSSFESGAALVELASVGDARLVTEAVASALDVRPLPAQELVAAVVDFLASRKLLLVLDNCEHLLSATAALADTLLRAVPQLTIVATSREPLRVGGEVLFRVPSLKIPDPEQPSALQRLAEYEAVSLFVELGAVEEVCAGAGLEAAETADALARLVEKSLVAVEDGERERRYRLLETVRMDARARLEYAGEAAPLVERHGQWALALAERERDSPRLERERANLRAALLALLAREPYDALRLCVALTPFWLRRIELEEAKRRFAQALAVAPERTPLRAEAPLAAPRMGFPSGPPA